MKRSIYGFNEEINKEEYEKTYKIFCDMSREEKLLNLDKCEEIAQKLAALNQDYASHVEQQVLRVTELASRVIEN